MVQRTLVSFRNRPQPRMPGWGGGGLESMDSLACIGSWLLFDLVRRLLLKVMDEQAAGTL